MFRLERYNNDCWRLLDEHGRVVAFALRLSNGRWALVDSLDRPMTPVSFKKPKDVLAAFERRTARVQEK